MREITLTRVLSIDRAIGAETAIFSKVMSFRGYSGNPGPATSALYLTGSLRNANDPRIERKSAKEEPREVPPIAYAAGRWVRFRMDARRGASNL